MKRGSLDISIGTLVVLILGVVIVAGGLVLVWRIVGEGQELSEGLVPSEESRLRGLLSEQLVAVSPGAQEAGAGERITFGLGVRNILPADETFSVLAEGRDANGSALNWDVRYFPTLDVAQGRDGLAVIDVTPSRGSPPGEYAFIVTVTADGAVYDTRRFFTVRVR